MKKLFALMMVGAFAVAIVACGGKKEETATAAVDSSVVSVDSTAVVDSIATPVDSVAKQ